MERKTTESISIPNVEKQRTKTIELSPKGDGEKIMNKTPETIKDDSQTKKTSFLEKLAAMIGMKPREKEEVTTTTEKSKTFGKISTINTKADQGKDQTMAGAAGHQKGQAAESKLPLVELDDLFSNLDQIDKKLKCSEKDRQELKKKHATEEKLQ